MCLNNKTPKIISPNPYFPVIRHIDRFTDHNIFAIFEKFGIATPQAELRRDPACSVSQIDGVARQVKPCPSRKSYPRVPMMQSEQNWRCDNRATGLDSSP
jgi:hypothetical protein